MGPEDELLNIVQLLVINVLDAELERSFIFESLSVISTPEELFECCLTVEVGLIIMKYAKQILSISSLQIQIKMEEFVYQTDRGCSSCLYKMIKNYNKS